MRHRNRTIYMGMILLALLFAAPSIVVAQNFVYLNKNTASAANSVAAYSVSSGGVLTEITGSPFATGGTGAQMGFYAANRALLCAVGNHLCIANDGSEDISVFSINPASGALTAVSGSPFSTAGSGYISFAATANFLYAGNFSSNNIDVYAVNPSTGALTAVSGSPFSAGSPPDGMMASPDGRFLFVALPFISKIAVFSINAVTGALTAITGSPFSSSQTPTGIAVNSSSTLLFVGNAASSISVYQIGATGALTEISGSPFSVSGSPQAVKVSPDDRFLVAVDANTYAVRILSVASGGALTEVSGSPYTSGVVQPLLPDFSQDGSLLYVPQSGGMLVYNVATNGSLTQATGSPVSVTGASFPSVASYPNPMFPSDQRMPVELSSFSARSNGGKVDISWRTGSELENAGFEIQRAAGEHGSFSTIGSFLSNPNLRGLGTSASGRNYAFTDDGSIHVGQEYRYRLVDVTIDGIRKEHAPLSVRVEADNDAPVAGNTSLNLFPVLPNPATDDVTISFSLAQSESITVDLYGADGSFIATAVTARDFGAGTHAERISTKGLPAGTYTLRLMTSRGGRVQSFVVVR